MPKDTRSTLREYYNAAASNYLDRASRGVMGWLRKRELALTLEMIPEGNRRKALDAGCGPGYYSQVMRDYGFDVTAIDLSPEMVSTVRGLGFPAYVMDIEHSEPPTELRVPFEFVFCAGVLEFAEDIARFLRSLRRMADENAEMMLVAPMSGVVGSVYTAYLKARGIPARTYSRTQLVAALEAAGFEPLEVRAAWPICLVARARASRQL